MSSSFRKACGLASAVPVALSFVASLALAQAAPPAAPPDGSPASSPANLPAVLPAVPHAVRPGESQGPIFAAPRPPLSGPAAAADVAPTVEPTAAPSPVAPLGDLPFERAQALALGRAPALQSRQAALDAARSAAIAAGQLPDPRLWAGVDNLPVTGPDRFSLTRDFMTMRSVGYMQDVPNAAKRDARSRTATARIEREAALLAAERSSVQREAAQAWLARHYAELRLALLDRLDTENRLLQDTVSARVAAGTAPPSDFTMARQEAVQLSDRRDDLLREREKALAALRRWVGAAAELPLTGTPPQLDIDPAQLKSHLARHVHLAGYGPQADVVRAQAAEIEAAKRGDWGWQVGVAKRGPAYSDMLSFQLKFELPLDPAQRQDPLIAAKLREADAIEADREEALRKATEEVDAQLADEAGYGRQLARLESRSRPLADQRVDLALAAYQAGRGDLGGVLAARRDRVELDLRALDLQGRRHAARAQLNYLIAGEAHP